MKKRDLVKNLKNMGWIRLKDRGKGSHLLFRKNNKNVVVPNHTGDYSYKTIARIAKSANIPFQELLKGDRDNGIS